MSKFEVFNDEEAHDDKDSSAGNEIRTDDGTHRLDMRSYVTKYDHEPEEEVFYHQVKDNVVNMNPDEDEDDIRKG